MVRNPAEPLDLHLVDFDNRPRDLPSPVEVGMPEDGQQPGLEIGPRAKMPERPKRPEIGFLDEVLGFRDVPRQPPRGASDGSELCQCLAVERLRTDGPRRPGGRFRLLG